MLEPSKEPHPNGYLLGASLSNWFPCSNGPSRPAGKHRRVVFAASVPRSPYAPRPERSKPVPICEESHSRVPASHRWGHRHQSPGLAGLVSSRSAAGQGNLIFAYWGGAVANTEHANVYGRSTVTRGGGTCNALRLGRRLAALVTTSMTISLCGDHQLERLVSRLKMRKAASTDSGARSRGAIRLRLGGSSRRQRLA